MRRNLIALMAVAAVSACRASAADGVTIQGKPLSQWLQQVQDSNRGLQMRAARALAAADPKDIPAIVPSLLPLLAADRENSRFPVAQVLGDYGPAARAAVPHLLPMLQGTQYERNRSAAAVALGQILKDAEPSDEVERVTLLLVAAFTDKYSDVRRESVRACGMIGPAAKSCLPALPPRFEDTEWLKDAECFLVRRAAAWTAGRMGKHGAVHIDRLISLLHANRPGETEFIDAIGEIGPVHQNVVPNVVDKIEKSIYGGFQGVSGEQLANYVSHGLAVLKRFGPASAPATDFLARLLAEGKYVEDTLAAVAAIGPPAAKTAAVIREKYAAHSSEAVRKAAEQALAAFGK
jgi:HEAT repeat protein